MARFAGLARWFGVLTAMALPTCGGNTSDRAPFSSGLPGDQVLNDLTPADKEHLCESGRAYLKNSGNGPYCKYSARVSASIAHAVGNAETEAEARKACADAQASCGMGSSGGVPCQAPVLVGQCSASVGEYEACVTEELAIIGKVVATFRGCSELTLVDVEVSTSGGKPPPGYVDPSSGPACQTLGDHCTPGSP